MRIAFTAVAAATAVAALINIWTLWLALVFVLALVLDRRIQHRRRADATLSFRALVSDRWVIAGTAGVAILSCLALVHLTTGWGVSNHRPLTVAAQLDQIKREAAQSNLYPVTLERVDLHGSGNDSYLMVFRERFPDDEPPIGQSDDLRIYDVVERELKLAFTFSPEPPPNSPDSVIWYVDGDSGAVEGQSPEVAHQPAFQFTLKSIEDVWQTSGPAVLGDWKQMLVVGVPQSPDFGSFSPMPVAVYWSPAEGRYKIATLITNSWARGASIFAKDIYERPHTLHDPESKITLQGYVVDEWSFERGPWGTSLLALFGWGYENSQDRAVIGGAAPVEGSPPETWRCSLDRDGGVFVRVDAPGGPTGPSPSSVLESAWASHGRTCDALSPALVPNPNG